MVALAVNSKLMMIKINFLKAQYNKTYHNTIY